MRRNVRRLNREVLSHTDGSYKETDDHQVSSSNTQHGLSRTRSGSNSSNNSTPKKDPATGTHSLVESLSPALIRLLASSKQ